MTTARQIITLGLESINQAPVGDTIDPDLLDVCLRRLNAIADEWSSGRAMMFRDLLTSGTVSGTSLTLGAGSFAAIGVGSEIQGVTADNYPTSQITFGQYRDIYLKTQSGRPLYWAFDGLATVFLYPAAVSNVIAVQTRQAISQFATLDTNYSLAPGYLSALSAQLALRVENSLNGKIAQATKDAAKATEMVIVAANVDPAIISANPMRRDNLGNGILQGWN